MRAADARGVCLPARPRRRAKAIDCDWRECGGLLLAHHPRQVRGVARRRRASGVEAGRPVRVLDADDLAPRDRHGRVRRRAAAWNGRPRCSRRSSSPPSSPGRWRRGRRGAPPHAGDPPRAPGTGFLVETTRGAIDAGDVLVAANAYVDGVFPALGSACCRSGASSSPPSRSRRAGARGDAGRPHVLRHQAPPELLAPRHPTGAWCSAVARRSSATTRRRRPRRALRGDGAGAPAAAGDVPVTHAWGGNVAVHPRSAAALRAARRHRVRHRVQRHRHRAGLVVRGSAPRPG